MSSQTPPFRLRLGALGADAPLPSDPAGDEEREALRLMAEAARAEPNDPDYYHILGEALLRAGKTREALRVCREAVERDPANAEYRFALGCSLWRADQPAEAERAFREAVQRQPDDPISLNALGASLVRLHHEAEAVSHLEKLVKLAPRNAEAWSNLGIARWGAGDQPGALRCFQRAVRLNPEELDLHRNLAVASRHLGRAGEAVTVLRNMVRRWPARAELYLDLAEALHEAGRHDEAGRAFDEARRLEPTAIAGRPRSRQIQDALRVRDARDETRAEQPPGWTPVALVHDGAVALFDFVGGLRRRVQVISVLALLLVLALVWLTVKVAPHYFTHYLVEDDIAGVARSPVREDSVVRDRLRRTVERRGLDSLDTERCRVKSDPGWRTITCDYAVRAQLLPGLWRELHFEIDVAQPYLVDPEPIVF